MIENSQFDFLKVHFFPNNIIKAGDKQISIKLFLLEFTNSILNFNVKYGMIYKNIEKNSFYVGLDCMGIFLFNL